MARLSRYTQKIFGSNAGVNQIGKFGSLAAGAPAYTTDPSLIQSLANYLVGWYGAVLGSNSPAIEDMNAIHYLYVYQLAYLFQSGVPEWDAATTYYTGNIAQDTNGNLYRSLQNTNLNHVLTDSAWWGGIAGVTAFRTVTTTAVATNADKIIRCDPTGGTFTVTLPVTTTWVGQKITIKCVGGSSNAIIITGNGFNIEGSGVPFNLQDNVREYATFFNNGTSIDIVE